MREGAQHPYRIEALAKGLQVLTAFDGEHAGLKTSDLAARVGLPLATVFRIVATLEEFGFLERHPDGSLYPGLSAVRVGGAALRSSSLLQASDRPLRALADATGETVNLGVLTHDRVLYLARIRNADLVTANVDVGSTLPAPYTSMGKSLLSYLGDAEIRRRITEASFVEHSGPNAVHDVDELIDQLARVRRQGYAVQDEELAPGLRSIAVSVVRSDGKAVAALNVAVAAGRCDVASLIACYADQLRDAAREIALRLDHR